MKNLVLICCMAAGCFAAAGVRAQSGETTLLAAAAASLRSPFENELIPLFQQKNPGITVEGTYDSSGKLQAQIENGLQADVFISAAPAQIDVLVSKGYIEEAAVVPLLENKIVLIQPVISAASFGGFEDVLKASVIAIGDPESVPAGQYAREVFTSLGIWEEVLAKASLGTNVTEVLHWVAESNAPVGVVYATDAAANPGVRVIAEAPGGTLKQNVMYPAAPLKHSEHPAEAKLFAEFLVSDEAMAIFEKYGFVRSR